MEIFCGEEKTIIVSIIAGIFILGLGVKPVYASEGISVIKNAAIGTRVVFDRQNEWIEQKIEEMKKAGEAQPEQEEKERMPCPQLVDGGFIYEMNGVLYFLDEDFKEASPLCNLRQLLGDFYMFSPRTIDICDVTEDASRMLVCLDEGLYEYDLESGARKLLESAYFAHHEIVLAEGDCACGQRDFRFDGPVKAEYGPDGQSYAFLTGTEEADWGDITGAFLRSAEGETLYQKETEYIDDFEWVESEYTVYLEVSYWEGHIKKMIDRVDVNTGEVMTFEGK